MIGISKLMCKSSIVPRGSGWLCVYHMQQNIAVTHQSTIQDKTIGQTYWFHIESIDINSS